MPKLNKSHIDSVDKDGMKEKLTRFPDHWSQIRSQLSDFSLNINTETVSNLCFAGMGGSAIGADLIRAYAYDSSPFPIGVIRHYNLPGWVDENTLFVGCSYSGNTEETLSAVKEAEKRGAQIIVVTSGGELLRKAQKNEYDYIKIPGGLPPRAALAYSFVPLFKIFQYLDLIPEGEEALDETEELLYDQVEMYSDLQSSEALELAHSLKDTLPIIYADDTLMNPVQLRWRGQLEENAKTLAYGNAFPEMNHNEIVGWDQIAHLTGRLSVLVLHDHDDNRRIEERMEITEDLIKDHTVNYLALETRGNSRLTRLFSLIQMADWTSFFLAILYEVDPTPVSKIDLLKSKLAEI